MTKKQAIMGLILLSAFIGELNFRSGAQFLPPREVAKEPSPDETTLAWAAKYRCAVVKVLMKHYPSNLKGTGYSDQVEVTFGTGFYVDSIGDILTATHTLFFRPPPTAGYTDTRRIINYDGSSVDFDEVSEKQVEDGRLSDVIVLHTSHKPPCFLQTGSAKNLHDGQIVYTLGFPAGHEDSYSLNGELHQHPLPGRGYFRENISDKYGPLLKIQLYGAKGSSGAPIVTAEGLAVGVVSRGSADRAITFASPLEATTLRELKNRASLPDRKRSRASLP